MKWSVCAESSSSSSEDDIRPILPETSSGELSPIEESHLEDRIESDSSFGTSTSKYMSSFINDSLSDISSLPDDDRSQKNVNFHEPKEVNDPSSIGETDSKGEANRNSSDEIGDTSVKVEIENKTESDRRQSNDSTDVVVSFSILRISFNVFNDI